MAEIIKLGTQYLDGFQLDTGLPYEEGILTIQDTVPGKELQWMKVGDLLVADRGLCCAISWNDLNEMGYIFGRAITIDGKEYICRSLSGGTRNGPNEWDKILDEVGDDDDLLHWKQKYFWCQEMASSEEKRVVRGYRNARYRHYGWVNTQDMRVGFRPVLEPIVAIPPDLMPLVGKKVRVAVPNWANIEGVLLEFDSYDLVLQTKCLIPPASSRCVRKAGEKAIISKEYIIRLKAI